MPSLRAELLLDLGLSGNARVVGAWLPEHCLAFETRPAHEDVLQSVIQHVAHVQHARDIRRRNHDRIRLLRRISDRFKASRFEPVGIPALFDFFGFVSFGDFRHDRKNGKGAKGVALLQAFKLETHRS